MNHLNELRAKAKQLNYYERKANFVHAMRIVTTIILLMVNTYAMVLELKTEFLMSMIPLNAMVIYNLWLSGDKNEKTDL